MAARNRGAAVLLVSEDLDEILELADRIVVIFNGRLVYEARASEVDLVEVGRHMAGNAAAMASAASRRRPTGQPLPSDRRCNHGQLGKYVRLRRASRSGDHPSSMSTGPSKRLPL